MNVEPIETAITGLHRGRRWILTPDAAAAATKTAQRLRDDGAAGVMVVAATEGVGDLPDVDRVHYTRSSGDSLMGGVRAFLASVEQPSAALLAAVDSFDPSGEALVLGQGFSREHRLAGRPVYGRRRRAWRDLEDKTTVDSLWDAAGVLRADAMVVAIDDAPRAAAALASDGGTVWVADNRTGWHGGGEYTRWVPPDMDPDDVVRWFTDRADHVRIMPFLEGIPCSIHGFATDDGVAVFLPFELLILRREDRPGFVYAQGTNHWTPPDEITTQMREAARSIGNRLRSELGYLGGFGVDGVATVNGFLPTELNPRLTLGHGIQARAADVPLGPMERMLLEGDLTVSAAELEDHVVAVVRDRREGGMIFIVDDAHEPDDLWFRFTEDGVEPTTDEATATGRMQLGPAAAGSIVLVTLEPDRVPVGPSLAPRAAQLMALADRRWNLDLPRVTPASDPFA